MNRSPISSTSEKETLSLLWGCELNQERPTWTFKPQKISLGEKAKEEVNVVEILPSASPDDKKRRPLTLASLRASVLPMVVLGLEFSPPVTFQLRAGSGPVFLCGQEHYNRFWEEVEEEDDDLEEEEDDDDDDEDIDMFLEETPVKQVKRLAPQKQTSAAKVREGCPRAPQKPGQRLQATPAKCSAQVFSGPGLAQTPPNARVGFQEKKVEKKEEAVR
uniref:Nucleophosmin/nucleoplasmin 2 n=1 Tax=Bos mutus grunniens TaxID=30521 RepID=A0A8B9WVA8_BOSMU